MLAEQIVDGKIKSVEPWYWVPLEEITDFYWDWRNDHSLTRHGTWANESEKFRASLHRFDINLEYHIQQVREERKKTGDKKANDPNEMLAWFGGIPEGLDDAE